MFPRTPTACDYDTHNASCYRTRQTYGLPLMFWICFARIHANRKTHKWSNEWKII